MKHFELDSITLRSRVQEKLPNLGRCAKWSGLEETIDNRTIGISNDGQ